MCKKLIYGLAIGMMSGGLLIEVTRAADKDLLGLWLLNEGSGETVADLSGQGHDGVLINPGGGLGPGGSAWDIDAVHNTVLSFNGNETSGAYVDCGDIIPEMNLVNHFTWAFWAKQEGDGTGVNQTMLGNRYGGTQSPVQFIKFTPTNFEYYNAADSGFINYDDLPADEWLHHVVVKQGPDMVYFRNGVEAGSSTATATINAQPFYIGGDASSERWSGRISDVRLYTRALSLTELLSVMAGKGTSPELATPSYPEDDAVDVIHDVVLSWSPGKFPGTHNVYFGESYDDVNSATVPTGAGLDVNSYEVGRLEFEKTYFWRVDEVNATPDRTVFKGDIWSFQVEPYAIQIPIDIDHATASSSVAKNPASKTVDGSGLAGNTHSTDSATMWLSGPADFSPWLMYEFDRVEKLDRMLIWNSNSSSEGFIGWGIKDVSIEYSTDGVDWATLAVPTELDRAPGLPTYDPPQVIDFGSVPAKYVKLNIQSNWGGILPQYGLSEVQFYGVPVHARTPIPASGSVDIRPDTDVTWRSGRQAGQHTIYVSDDPNAVTDGVASSASSMTNSVNLSPFDLQMSQTYYWRVDEVNEAEAPSMWAGPVWSLSTADALIVDDFESYTNFSPDRPFQTWIDGYGFTLPEPGNPGNGTGAGIGHDIWSPSSPYFNGNIMETSNTLAGSSQAMPFYYSNSGGVASKTERMFATPQDWTVGGAKVLSIAFNGQAGNTGMMYVMINNTKVVYDSGSSALAGIGRSLWQIWNIDLASVNTNLQSVTKVEIGVEGSGASGMLLIDDIRLSAEAIVEVISADITTPGDVVKGVPDDGDWPAAEYPDLAIDNDATTKFLHRKGGAMPTGIQLEPMVGATVVTGLILTTANDTPTRDPITFELSGSNVSIDGPYTLIAASDVVDFAGATEWPRFTPNETPIEFSNTVAYAYYQVVFPTLRGATETLMQIAEVELISTP